MIFLLDDKDPTAPFPDPASAETDPNGLLALGGDLSPTRLIAAYSAGIFPWFTEAQPILWWSPDPRMVLYPEELRISRSLHKTLKRGTFEVSIDQAFDRVIEACARPRRGVEGTWLVADMIAAYRKLHACGLAHSVEAWQGGKLVGGLYGIALGRVFFGESMYSDVANASKVALIHLVDHLRKHDYRVIDCQVASEHLERMGARTIPRTRFQHVLATATREMGCDLWAQTRRTTCDPHQGEARAC